MSLPQVNLLNIGLMLLSLAVAFAVPFETFLFAYAVLGPLHYLTQISWLHDRGYFTRRRFDWVPLVVLTVLVTTSQQVILIEPSLAPLGRYAVDLLFFAFGLSLLLAVTADAGMRAAGAVALAGLAFLLHGSPTNALLFALFVPTLIHVFVFTGAFVLHGALKSRSITAHASFATFLLCGAAALWLDPGGLGYTASQYAIDSYQSFAPMHVHLVQVAGLAGAAAPAAGNPFFPFAGYGELFTEPASLRAGRFIAFAYTYHYLNWFSKTSVIRWHEVPRRRLVAVVVVWIASLALYAADFALGIRWLLLLSFAHVLLEFPLDHRTFLGIGQEVAARLRR